MTRRMKLFCLIPSNGALDIQLEYIYVKKSSNRTAAYIYMLIFDKSIYYIIKCTEVYIIKCTEVYIIKCTEVFYYQMY